MTDAGGFKSAETCPRLTEQERLLRQIADLLNLPVAHFRRERAALSTADGPTATECEALLAAFSRIRDPEQRRQCLAMIERCADA